MITETAGSVAPATTREFGAAIVWLRAKIGEPKVAMLTSADRRYMPSSRPMITQQIDDDGVLWFFAASDGDLAESIEANPRVNVSYSDTARGAFASLSGYARLVFDPERKIALWNPAIAIWFPDSLVVQFVYAGQSGIDRAVADPARRA